MAEPPAPDHAPAPPPRPGTSRRAVPGADLLLVDFTHDAQSFPCRRAGWSFHEPGGVWTEGPESDLLLPEPEPAPGYTLLLSVRPMLPGLPGHQRLGVRVDDTQVAAFTVTADQTLSCAVPASALRRDGRLRIAFSQPDATRPCDVSDSRDRRLLGFLHTRLALRRATASTPTAMPHDDAAALLSRFQSLGDTCEFGFLQRRFGLETLGLFRFAGIRLHRLLDGLEDDFAALGDPGQLRIMSDGSAGSRDVYHMRYGYVYHAFRPDEELRHPEFGRREAGRLRFLWRLLRGDLGAAERIFVIRTADPVEERHLRLLMAQLRRHGDVTLLWVVEADDAPQVGTVADLGGRLLKGHVAYLTSERAYDFDESSWLQVCAEAARLADRRDAP